MNEKPNDVLMDDRFLVTVKVGPKGQITIPAVARKMFDIKEGDTLIVLGDSKRGIALMKSDLFYDLMPGGVNNDSNQNK